MISIKRVRTPRKKKIRVGRIRLAPKTKPVSRFGQVRVEPSDTKPPVRRAD